MLDLRVLQLRSTIKGQAFMKTRREVLQGLIISIGGASMLSACGGEATVAPSTGQTSRYFSEDELALVSRLSNLIIPRTDTPGALDVGVPGFMDSLMADWANADSKASQHESISQISADLGEDFAAKAEDDAEEQLQEYDAAAYADRSDHRAYRSLKGLITQSYFASEDGALQERGWVAVPGRWDPCVEIEA